MAGSNPDMLTRIEVADALTAAGYRISAGTLAVWASHNFGPPYRRIAGRCYYNLADALAFMKARHRGTAMGQRALQETAKSHTAAA